MTQTLLTREFTIRTEPLSDGHAFDGVAVPWNVEIDLGGRYYEQIAPGACQPTAADVFVFWRHREVIGRVTTYTDSPEGWEISGEISRTTQGDDAATLLRDGVITKLSIGFLPVEHTETIRDDGSTLITYTNIDVREVSLVPIPAYPTTAITNVREHKETQRMPTDTLTRADLTPLAEGLEDLERSIAALTTAPPAPHAGHQWRSLGHFLKALAAGDDAAAAFHRDYTGATTADTVTKDTFVGDFIRFVSARRKYVELVTTATLPADGMSVDYVKLDADTTQVAEQVNQGDDLAGGKVVLRPDNAPVKTYGGYSELSRQLIERSNVPTLDITLKALAIKYARHTDSAVKAALVQLIDTRTAANSTDETAAIELGGTTTDHWLDAIVDAAELWDDKGYALTTLAVSADKFKELIRLKDGTTRLMTVYGQGINQVGELNLRSVSGNIADVTVRVLSGTTGKAAFIDPAAVTFLESAGAPAQLQDENVINLTKAFSLYGYAAILTPFPDAVLPITSA